MVKRRIDVTDGERNRGEDERKNGKATATLDKNSLVV